MGRALRSPPIAIFSGTLLVLVPTLFSVFPEWTKWSDGVRVIVVVGWVAVAIFVVAGAARQSGQLDRLLSATVRRRDESRSVAGQELLHAILRPGDNGIPAHYEARLFLPGEDEHGVVLTAEYESAGSTPSLEGWRPGRGATGVCWQSASYVMARGDSVSNSEYGLTPAQQARYKHLQVVAAAPVVNARTRPIGVLAISSTFDDGFFDGAEAVRRHNELAQVVARVLIDVFRVSGD